MPSSRYPMFFRLLTRSALVQRGRTITALVAMVVAAAVSTALLDLYADIGAKLNTEFRKFGANAVVVAGDGSSLSPETIAKVNASLTPGDISVPFAYAVAKTGSGRPIVVAGTDFKILPKLDPWWSVPHWPDDPHSALIGQRAAVVLQSEDHPEMLLFRNKPFHLASIGQVRTGGPEDSRIYVPLPEFVAWTGISPSTLELALQGSPTDVDRTISALRADLRNEKVQVLPVRQIVEAETKVLDKTRSVLLLSAILIAVMVTLCVLATLTASVMERRKDYAVMKALGSSQRMVNTIFLSESLAVAVLGAVLGFVVGCAIAAWIGYANFHATILPRFNVFPVIFLGCLAIAAMSAILPLTLLQKLQPAAMLKGD